MGDRCILIVKISIDFPGCVPLNLPQGRRLMQGGRDPHRRAIILAEGLLATAAQEKAAQVGQPGAEDRDKFRIDIREDKKGNYFAGKEDKEQKPYPEIKIRLGSRSLLLDERRRRPGRAG